MGRQGCVNSRLRLIWACWTMPQVPLESGSRAVIRRSAGPPRVPAQISAHIASVLRTVGASPGPWPVFRAARAVRQAGMAPLVMIDASHGNSRKDHARQAEVARQIAAQIGGGQGGIAGVMLESFLVPGRQELASPAGLTYGQSVTDACMGWDTTADVLADLAAAVRGRRSGATGR
jgi:DAHP synthetase I family